MNPSDLAAALELMAQALRHLPAAAAAAPQPQPAPAELHRTLAEWHAEMTEVYKDDRGLSRDQYKRVTVPGQPRTVA